SVACLPAAGTAHAQYVWNAVMVPMQRSDYAYDLNGDGRVDNQYGNIVGALASNNIDVQGSATQAITSGQSITLVNERSSDATFAADACAATTMFAGNATASPDYSGAGHFTVDGSATAGHFAGPIAAARFTSDPPPASAKVPTLVDFNLPLFGSTPVDLVGARITYVRAADGTVTGGQLNGAMRKYDIDHTVVPSVAGALNLSVQTNPSSSTSMQILAIFDNGGKPSAACGMMCQNLDGSCAIAHDNVISDCEVGTNSIIQNVLAPDVQMFDAAGNYHPNPANTNKDSLSIGVGFTAVPATF
ncbi:MAG TPA: hypothetical protein VHB97_13880, partial [Polyangia bacterium]|nr:hypothetical protein [Polyangia bacterium]